MCKNGYIKFFRKIQEWEWYHDIPCFRLFTHCLVRANYAEQMFHGIKIPAGSFITSLKQLSLETGLSISQIRTAIKKLEMTHNLALKSHANYSVITVIKYNSYQTNDTQLSNNIRIEEYNNSTIKGNTYYSNKANNYYIDPTEKTKNTEKTKIFQKPSIEEIKDYCVSRNNNVDANRFFDYYESKGWTIGKSKMKDWKAAVRTWENQNKKGENANETKPTIRYRTV